MSIKQRGLLSSVLTLTLATVWTLPAQAGLDGYVKKPDPAFSWTLASSKTTDGTTVHWIKLTSQVWQGIRWTHNLSIIEPKELAYPDAAVLFITGGKVGDGPRDRDLEMGLALAKVCRARVAVLPQVPNQPLLGGKNEDALIAETFVRYLETKDEEWPLLFPMVKSAVKAMDAVQAFAREQGKPVTRFVVTGASKRGWTTWLTGASDPRVKGIAPMVIPTLNIDAQNEHQLENFDGKFSEQIRDYTERGLIGKDSKPNAAELLAMVDPFTYRNRLKLPKLQINGTNDPYWTLDSLNLYWDELVGPSWVVYLPNAGHGLDNHRDYALSGVGALFRHAIGEQPFPKVSWKHDDQEGMLRLVVDSVPAPKSALVWAATSESLDFRESKWTSNPLAPTEKMTVLKERPGSGNIAFFADLEYEIEGLPYHLSTQIRQTNIKPSQ